MRDIESMSQDALVAELRAAREVVEEYRQERARLDPVVLWRKSAALAAYDNATKELNSDAS